MSPSSGRGTRPTEGETGLPHSAKPCALIAPRRGARSSTAGWRRFASPLRAWVGRFRRARQSLARPATTVMRRTQSAGRPERGNPGRLRRHASPATTASLAPLPGARATVQPTTSRKNEATKTTRFRVAWAMRVCIQATVALRLDARDPGASPLERRSLLHVDSAVLVVGRRSTSPRLGSASPLRQHRVIP